MSQSDFRNRSTYSGDLETGKDNGAAGVTETSKELFAGDTITADTGARYRVLSPLTYANSEIQVASGQARLYLCHPASEDDMPYRAYIEAARKPYYNKMPILGSGKKKPYVVKIYTKLDSIPFSVIEQLRGETSPYIAPILDSGLVAEGVFTNRSYEVYEYYRRGNLSENKFGFADYPKLVQKIADGLKFLHGKKIIHKDIKPSNILLCEDGITPAIIDFGISAKLFEDAEVYKNTVVAHTPAFVAPEIIHARLPATELSDYYSLGVTLYALWFGLTPADRRIMDASGNRDLLRVYFPENAPIPSRLKLLIEALTFADPQSEYMTKRWAYEMVSEWCQGASELHNPWDKSADNGTTGEPLTQSFSFEFNGAAYNSLEDTMLALIKNTRAARRFLFGSTNVASPAFAANRATKAAELARDAYDANSKAGSDEEKTCVQSERLWKLVYETCPGIKAFYWNDEEYDDFGALTDAAYNRTFAQDPIWETDFDRILRGGILSAYLKHMKYDLKAINLAEAVEKGYTNKNQHKWCAWKLRYISSADSAEDGKDVFMWAERRFDGGLSEFADMLIKEIANSQSVWRKHLDSILRGGLLNYYISVVRPDITEYAKVFRKIDKLEKEYQLLSAGDMDDFRGGAVYTKLIFALTTNKALNLRLSGEMFTKSRRLAELLLSETLRDNVKLLKSKLLSAFFAYCGESEQKVEEIESLENLISEKFREPYEILWRISYGFCDELTSFFWAGEEYVTLSDFGKTMKARLTDEYYGQETKKAPPLEHTRTKAESWKNWYALMADSHIVSAYLRRCAASQKQIDTVESHEKRGDEQPYHLAYEISGDPSFYINGQLFTDIDSLVLHMSNVLKREGYDSFIKMLDLLISNGAPRLPFKVWLDRSMPKDRVWKAFSAPKAVGAAFCRPEPARKHAVFVSAAEFISA